MYTGIIPSSLIIDATEVPDGALSEFESSFKSISENAFKNIFFVDTNYNFVSVSRSNIVDLDIHRVYEFETFKEIVWSSSINMFVPKNQAIKMKYLLNCAVGNTSTRWIMNASKMANARKLQLHIEFNSDLFYITQKINDSWSSESYEDHEDFLDAIQKL